MSYRINDHMKSVDNTYFTMFGEELGTDRLNELDLLLLECASLDDLEALADCDDATISFGEFEALLPVAKKVYGLEYES